MNYFPFSAFQLFQGQSSTTTQFVPCSPAQLGSEPNSGPARCNEQLQGCPAHGFHHLDLTHHPSWKTFWTFLLIISGLALVICIVYYFYYIFALGVYSRFLLVSPTSLPWPTTILCDRQVSQTRLIFGAGPTHDKKNSLYKQI